MVIVTTLTIKLSRIMLIGANPEVSTRVRSLVTTEFNFTMVSTVLVRSALSLCVPTRHSGSVNISVNLLVVTVVVDRPFYENAPTWNRATLSTIGCLVPFCVSLMATKMISRSTLVIR